MLVGSGVDVHAFDTNLGNALQVAARNGHNEVIRILVKAGVKPNSAGGATHGPAIVCATANGHLETVKLLFELGLRKGPRVCNNNALLTAVWAGNEDLIRLLIDIGADINSCAVVRPHEECTPLQAAALKGDEKTLRLLLDLGADLNARNRGEHGTALLAAIASEEESDIVTILLDAGADPNGSGTGNPGLPLNAAITKKDKELVVKLLAHGADPNMCLPEVQNPIAMAAWAAGTSDNDEILELMIAKGGDINTYHHISYDPDNTPLMAAITANSTRMVKELVTVYGAHIVMNGKRRVRGPRQHHIVSALDRACNIGELEMIRLLIELGADVDVRGGCSGTPLQSTIEKFASHIFLSARAWLTQWF